MIICCIGDSLTEGDYGIPGVSGVANVHAENYPYFLARATGAEVRNFGKCGWRSSHMLKWAKEGGLNLTGADLILLLLGANGGQKALGDSEENTAYAELVEFCRKEAPQARLVLMTPPNVTTNPKYSNFGYGGQVAEAVGFVRRFAAAQGLEVINLAANSRFTPNTEDDLQSNDGVHFNEKGYRAMAEEVLKSLRELGVSL